MLGLIHPYIGVGLGSIMPHIRRERGLHATTLAVCVMCCAPILSEMDAIPHMRACIGYLMCDSLQADSPSCSMQDAM
jgi:hypothetical protein